MPRLPKTLRQVRYTVRGSGVFPFDMLRYDRSRPAEPEDREWIGPGLGTEPRPWEHKGDVNFKRDTRELMLVTYLMPWHGTHCTPRKGWVMNELKRPAETGEFEILVPCAERWRSFGWRVTQVYPVVRIPFDQVPAWMKNSVDEWKGWDR